MAENIESKKKLDFENEKLQQTFQSLFASNIERVKPQRETENFPNKLHKPIRAQFCTKFLRENRDWLK